MQILFSTIIIHECVLYSNILFPTKMTRNTTTFYANTNIWLYSNEYSFYII